MQNENKIQAYVHETMGAQERSSFEIEMSRDPGLAAQFKEYKNLHNAILYVEENELKTRLQGLDKDSNSRKKERSILIKFKPYLLPLAAASVILIIALGTGLFDRDPNNMELYDTYFTKHPNTLLPITRTTNNPDPKILAFIAYEAGEFDKAASLFKKVLNLEDNPDIEFYHSMSLLNSGKEKSALFILNKLKKGSTQYVPQTYWYAALVELKNGDKKRTIELIDSLQLLHPDFKKEKAIELENVLNQ